MVDSKPGRAFVDDAEDVLQREAYLSKRALMCWAARIKVTP